MKVVVSYKYKKDGIIGITCGKAPKGSEIISETKLLVADEGFELVDKSNKIIGDIVVLEYNDSEDNYTEIEKEKENIE